MMPEKIFIQVKPRAKKDSIKRIDDLHFEICTKSPPHDGKANAAVIKALSQYLGIPQSRIKILFGFKSKQKIIEVS